MDSILYVYIRVHFQGTTEILHEYQTSTISVVPLNRPVYYMYIIQDGLNIIQAVLQHHLSMIAARFQYDFCMISAAIYQLLSTLLESCWETAVMLLESY